MIEFFLGGLINGLAVGSIYALIALGFALLYKSTKILNLAHGELVLFGGYLAIALSHVLPFPAAVFVTLLAAGILGFAIERAIMRPLFGQPLLSVIIVTLALGYIVRGVMVGLWGGDTRQFAAGLPTGVTVIAGIAIQRVGIYSAATAAALLLVFWLFFRYSLVGIAMRAAANEQLTASTLGVSLRRVFAYAWAFAAIAGAVGGVLLGLWLGVNFALGFVGLKALAAVILGGLDSIPGAIVGGLLIGVIETTVGGYIDAHIIYGFKEIVAFIIILLVLMIRPYGLFGTEHIERL
ncbi:MAG: branched-chain amino acid ABC transporter permease [Armatimonadota bacterium]|nr:branched-chain amino acid ABC transporter permease [Armatimonadota bacterium]MDR7450454.1 branched-chain amino acid ABC transporter permease [Armatimonadota bacterium]MDR7466963.1 branched-chain amino acid ABC transporter permease [Armatimonadota bacterium]MDR7493495.1 branched-chain amino acid ABC transporter permease [Armatimonadota bacterium]MDR7498760.1 branched-chain amino acid ABC transporter permease [Armatimonadota bacterium]